MSGSSGLRGGIDWLMGDPEEGQREPGSTALAIFIVCIAAVSIQVDLRHPISRAPVLDDVWTLALFGAVPLAALLAWELGRGAKTAAWGVWALGTLAIAAPLTLRLGIEEWDQAMRADPLLMLLPVVCGGAVLIATALLSDIDLGRWGLGAGDWRWWGPRAGLLVVGMVLMVAVAAWLFPDLRDAYPRHKEARNSLTVLLQNQLAMGWYMLGWEFFFRGFLLFGLARRGDLWLAILFQAMPFFILHQHKPEIEMAASFVGALGAGWFCLRARSFLPLFLLHWGMNLSMDVVGFLWRQGGG